MPAYPTRPDLGRRINDIERRLSVVEAQLANRTNQAGGGGGGTRGDNSGDVYDANVIFNSGFENGGLAGWQQQYYGGAAPGSLNLETAAPLNGLRSLRSDEQADSDSRYFFFIDGHPTRTPIESSALAVQPGQVWLISALLRASVPTVGAEIGVACGVTYTDAFAVDGGNTTWITAAVHDLDGSSVASLAGTITIPPGHNYMAFWAAGTGTPRPTVPWSWWLDNASMQMKL